MNYLSEKGSSLLVVLLLSLILTILGLSILGAAINNVKRTEIRELEVETTASGKMVMSEVLAKLQYNLAPGKSATDPAEEIKTILHTNDIPYGTLYNERLDDIITATENFFNVSSDIKVKFCNLSSIIPEAGCEDYKDEITNYIKISNIGSFNDSNFTRIYKIIVEFTNREDNNPTVKRTLTENVILSPTPSFFNYAVGSNERLTINGSPDIVGNVYTPIIQTNEAAGFILDDGSINPRIRYTQAFDGPSIFGTLFANDYQLNADFFDGSYSEVVEDKIIDGRPTLKPTGKDFVDMKFDETFQRKVTDDIFGRNLIFDDEVSNINDVINDLNSRFLSNPFYTALSKTGKFHLTDEISAPDPDTDDEITFNEYERKIREDLHSRLIKCTTCTENFYLIENDFDSKPLNIPSDHNPKYLYFTNIVTTNGEITSINSEGTLELSESVDLNGGWLIVNGDLKIVSGDEDTPVNIKGNILVTGDFTVLGKCDSKVPETSCDKKNMINFKSTVYAKKKGTIYNTNIGGIDDGGLVLLSKERLLISRINEYEDVGEKKESIIDKINDTPRIKPGLKAFFYTEDKATLYGVGSKMYIEGGVFARKSLVINAARGSVEKDTPLSSIAKENPEYRGSRFFVEYDPRVITSQLNALPRVDRLQMIPDHLFIK